MNRAKLTMCRGLPGSGKTTWAMAQPATVRVNQDAIRRELGWTSWAAWDFTGPAENEVHAIKIRRIELGLSAGRHVISDDTNLGRKRKLAMEELAKAHDADFAIKDFTDVPVDVCIKRDNLRVPEARVGEAVIHKMAVQYGLSTAPTYDIFAHVRDQQGAAGANVICDLDGTLALFKGQRSPYDTARCETDIVNTPVCLVIRQLSRSGWGVIYLSGREDKFRAATLRWLARYNCPVGRLHMRATGDKRKDWIVKGELFDAHIRGQYYIDFVLDDRNQVVNFWRHIGLTCFQVAEGSF